MVLRKVTIKNVPDDPENLKKLLRTFFKISVLLNKYYDFYKKAILTLVKEKITELKSERNCFLNSEIILR